MLKVGGGLAYRASLGKFYDITNYNTKYRLHRDAVALGFSLGWPTASSRVGLRGWEVKHVAEGSDDRQLRARVA
jgi:hypothetical protein